MVKYVTEMPWKIWDSLKRKYLPNRTFARRVDAERFITSLTKGKRNVRTADLRLRLTVVQMFLDGSCPDAVDVQSAYDSLMENK